MNKHVPLRPRTVTLLTKFMRPLADEGLMSVPEMNTIIANLRYLANKGELFPVVVPRLLNQREASEMLSVSLTSFKRQEKEGTFPFKRKMVGSSVRYRNVEILKYIMLDDDPEV